MTLAVTSTPTATKKKAIRLIRTMWPLGTAVYLGSTELSRDRNGRFTAPFETRLVESCTAPEGLEHCVILHPLRIEDNFGNVHTQAVVYLVDDEQPALRFTFVNGIPIDEATSQGGVVQVLAGQRSPFVHLPQTNWISWQSHAEQTRIGLLAPVPATARR